MFCTLILLIKQKHSKIYEIRSEIFIKDKIFSVAKIMYCTVFTSAVDLMANTSHRIYLKCTQRFEKSVTFTGFNNGHMKPF